MITTCGVFIFDKSGMLLVGHPTGHPYTGHIWSIPKGEMDQDEDKRETAVRETMEEANIHLDPEQLKYVGSAIYKSRAKRLEAFAVRLPQDSTEIDVKCTSEFQNHKGIMTLEIDHFKWIDPILAPEILHGAQTELLPKALELLRIS